MKNLIEELKELSLNNEIWMPFKNCNGIYYSVSNKGRFSSGVSINPRRHRGRGWKVKILSPYANKKGYMLVRTKENHMTKHYQLHRVVLMTFAPCDNMELLQVNHIDGNKSNNNLSNLEWCTCQENIEHSIRTGLVDLTKNVSMYSLSGDYIKTFKSITQAELETKVIGVNISSCCKGKIRQTGGYQWSYEKVNNIGMVRPKKIAEDLKTRYCKPIIAIQDNIKKYRFNSVLEAGEFIGASHANVNISACALGKRKSAYGYQWQFALEASEGMYGKETEK